MTVGNDETPAVKRGSAEPNHDRHEEADDQSLPAGVSRSDDWLGWLDLVADAVRELREGGVTLERVEWAMAVVNEAEEWERTEGVWPPYVGTPDEIALVRQDIAQLATEALSETETQVMMSKGWKFPGETMPFPPSRPVKGDGRGRVDAGGSSVYRRLAFLRADREARSILAAEGVGPVPHPVDLLAVDDEAEYRVEELWPSGGNVVLAAEYKAGKTTLRDNLTDSMLRGAPFLNRFDMRPVRGSVVVLDLELSERMIRRWLGVHGLTDHPQLFVWSLRGQVGTLNLLDDRRRDEWAGHLRDVGAEVVILDPLRPLLDALGLDENHDAGRVLNAFDDLLAEAGVSEGMVIHHAGHGAERSRGDSRLRDWPDAEWVLTVEKDDDGQRVPDGTRFLRAEGRDVSLPETALEFDPETLHLTLGAGNRAEVRSDRTLVAVLEAVEAEPGITSGNADEAVMAATGVGERVAQQARSSAIRKGCIAQVQGPANSRLHTLTDAGREYLEGVRKSTSPAGPAEPLRNYRVSSPAPLGGGTTTRPPESSSAARAGLRDSNDDDAGGIVIDLSTYTGPLPANERNTT